MLSENILSAVENRTVVNLPVICFGLTDCGVKIPCVMSLCDDGGITITSHQYVFNINTAKFEYITSSISETTLLIALTDGIAPSDLLHPPFNDDIIIDDLGLITEVRNDTERMGIRNEYRNTVRRKSSASS